MAIKISFATLLCYIHQDFTISGIYILISGSLTGLHKKLQADLAKIISLERFCPTKNVSIDDLE